MHKKEIYSYLESKKVLYEVVEHNAVFNMKDLEDVKLPYPECDAKNLFIRDDKKRNYYLITVKGDKRVDLKTFRRQHELRALSFASEKELSEIMGLIPGAVTPLGILNDKENKVHFYLDKEFEGKKIAVHPNDNTATIYLQADDLIRLIKEHGNEVELTEL